MLIAVGLLFVIAGLFSAFLVINKTLEIGTDKIIVFILFELFAVLGGGAIVINQLIYLFSPAVMLRVDSTGVSFGTGLRYKLFSIDKKFVDSIEVYERPSELEVMGKAKIVAGGIEIKFKNDPVIPASLATSAGITYFNYVLTIHKPYMEGDPIDYVDQIKEKISLSK